jgi:hypothetical protein
MEIFLELERRTTRDGEIHMCWSLTHGVVAELVCKVFIFKKLITVINIKYE